MNTWASVFCFVFVTSPNMTSCFFWGGICGSPLPPNRGCPQQTHPCRMEPVSGPSSGWTRRLRGSWVWHPSHLPQAVKIAVKIGACYAKDEGIFSQKEFDHGAGCMSSEKRPSPNDYYSLVSLVGDAGPAVWGVSGSDKPCHVLLSEAEACGAVRGLSRDLGSATAPGHGLAATCA